MFDPSRRPVCSGAILVLAGLLSASGCGDAGPVSGPGTLTAIVESPNGAEGAALIWLIGTGVESLEPLIGDFHTSVVGDTTKVLVILDAPGNIVFHLKLADMSRPPRATVLQVADGQNELRADLIGYGVRYTP